MLQELWLTLHGCPEISTEAILPRRLLPGSLELRGAPSCQPHHRRKVGRGAKGSNFYNGTFCRLKQNCRKTSIDWSIT